MEKVSIIHDDLASALVRCMNEREIISCNKLEDNESIHYVDYKGFYYEDGCFIARYKLDVIAFLEKQNWTSDAKWYSIRRMNKEDESRLEYLHELYGNGGSQHLFEQCFMKMINDVKEG